MERARMEEKRRSVHIRLVLYFLSSGFIWFLGHNLVAVVKMD